MSATTLSPGTRVRVTAPALGTIRLGNPYKFTDYIADVGDAGEVVEAPWTLPEEWVLVRLDHPHDDGDTLYLPVHPSMVEET